MVKYIYMGLIYHQKSLNYVQILNKLCRYIIILEIYKASFGVKIVNISKLLVMITCYFMA